MTAIHYPKRSYDFSTENHPAVKRVIPLTDSMRIESFSSRSDRVPEIPPTPSHVQPGPREAVVTGVIVRVIGGQQVAVVPRSWWQDCCVIL
jgi:hypothetical protein